MQLKNWSKTMVQNQKVDYIKIKIKTQCHIKYAQHGQLFAVTTKITQPHFI